MIWVEYPDLRAALRPRGGTFGEPFEFDAGNSSYVPWSLAAVALPDGEVLAAWSGPNTLQEMRVKSLFPDGTIATALPTEPGGAFPAIAANSAGMVALAYYSFNEVRLAIRPAGADAFEPSVLLTTLVGNEKPAGTSSNEGVVRALDVTVREDGQVAVAIGTEVDNPPGGTARMLIARHAGGTTTVEPVDSRTLNLTPPPRPDGERRVPRRHGAAPRRPPAARLPPGVDLLQRLLHTPAARRSAGRQPLVRSAPSRADVRPRVRREGARPERRRSRSSLALVAPRDRLRPGGAARPPGHHGRRVLRTAPGAGLAGVQHNAGGRDGPDGAFRRRAHRRPVHGKRQGEGEHQRGRGGVRRADRGRDARRGAAVSGARRAGRRR